MLCFFADKTLRWREQRRVLLPLQLVFRQVLLTCYGCLMIPHLLPMLPLSFMLALSYDSCCDPIHIFYLAAMIYPHPPHPINLLYVCLAGLASRSCMLRFVCSRVLVTLGLTCSLWSLGSFNQHHVNVWGNINFDEGTGRRPGMVLKPASAETRKSPCPLDPWWAR